MGWSKLFVGVTGPKRLVNAGYGPYASRNAVSLGFTEIRRLGKSEKNHLLASHGADVMVHGHNLDASDLLDHRLHDWTGRFNQMGPNLLQQVPPLFGGKRFDQLLLGCGQDPMKANDEEIAKQVGVNVLRSPAYVILFEATNPSLIAASISP